MLANARLGDFAAALDVHRVDLDGLRRPALHQAFANRLAHCRMVAGRLDLDAFVSEEIGLGDVEAAFDKMHDGSVLRSVVIL